MHNLNLSLSLMASPHASVSFLSALASIGVYVPF